MDNLVKIIQAMTDAVFEWFDCLSHPYQTCDQVVSEEVSARDKIAKSLRLWGTAFAISLILQLPLYRFAGIDWKDMQFNLSNVVLVLLILLLTLSVIHLGLRAYRIDSKLPDTVAIYAVMVGCFSPLVVILQYPSNINLLLQIQHAKHESLDLYGTIAYVLKGVATPGESYFDILASVSSGLLPFVSFLLIAALVNRISAHYQVDKYKVASSVAMSMMLITFPVIFLAALLMFAMYVAIT